MTKTLNILFLASEAEPFVKIGGLADVAGSLPLALRNLPLQVTQDTQLDVRLVLPLHRSIRAESVTLRPVAEFPVYRRGGNLPVQVFEIHRDGMPVYFLSGEPISGASSVYSQDLTADREKYAFFSMAVLEMVRRMKWRPDILHANDWHTALAVYGLRKRQADPAFHNIRSMLTLHNLPYMGGDGADALAAYGLEPLHEDVLPTWAHTQPLPLGLWAADAVVPVSPTYAREILTPDFGCGLDGFLRTRAGSITGVLNGLDMDAWDPASDDHLAVKFTYLDLYKRAANKAALQEQLGLNIEPRIPLLAMIGRIDPQKGVDITLEALRRLTDRAWQFVILGSSDPALETAARNLEGDFPERVRAAIRFDARLSRLIYGGADMFLMPSRYEPCGLAQMIAMRYGCVPVVHATGGLKDTVQDGRTGFLFKDANVESMLEALQWALSVYSKPQWEHFQRCGMQEDFSWPRFAAQYASLYRSLTSD
jgi:starch synthase